MQKKKIKYNLLPSPAAERKKAGSCQRAQMLPAQQLGFSPACFEKKNPECEASRRPRGPSLEVLRKSRLKY